LKGRIPDYDVIFLGIEVRSFLAPEINVFVVINRIMFWLISLFINIILVVFIISYQDSQKQALKRCVLKAATLAKVNKLMLYRQTLIPVTRIKLSKCTLAHSWGSVESVELIGW